MDFSTTNVLMGITVGSLALLLVVVAAFVIGRGAEERDLGGRLRSVVNPETPSIDGQLPGGEGLKAIADPFRRLGDLVRNAALVSEKDVEDFRRQILSAGLNPRAALPTFIGIKAVLLIVAPLAGFLYASAKDYEVEGIAVCVFGGIFVAMMGPGIVLGFLRRPYEKQLRKGLPDALDLLVVAAEAGLGLESALDKVVKEMRASNPAVTLEFHILVQELRMLPDRREALERFGERSNVEGFKRIGATLSQTLRYGTPLAQALRTLSGELRTERMLAIEEKAIRLPALLVIPLILFIMPAVFIALVGPSVLELGRNLTEMGQ